MDKNNTRRTNKNKKNKTRRMVRNVIVNLAEGSKRENERFKRVFPQERNFIMFLSKMAKRYRNNKDLNNLLEMFPSTVYKNTPDTNEYKNTFIDYLARLAEEENGKPMKRENIHKVLREYFST
jgi:hypothetical protein